MTGVGTFGYFDTEERRYHLFSSREVASSEISALLVEPDYVWLSLDHFGEDISRTPGGFARWNRSTHETKLYPFEFLIGSILRQGDILRLSTNGGYALFQNDGHVKSFVVTKTESGVRPRLIRNSRHLPARLVLA